MKNLFRTAVLIAVVRLCGTLSASAQSMDALNLQVHGYSTQGLVYSTSNNWNAMDSTLGSSTCNNTGEIRPHSRMKLLKLGVSF